MENVVTIFWQIVTMVLLAGVGYWLFRSGKISSEGSKALANILIFLSLPCVVVNSFLLERTPERVLGLLVSAGAAAVVLGISIVLSRLLLGRNAIDCFAGAFSNPGFFGTPLIIASLGNGGVFYIATFIAFLNILQWTYGVSLLERSDASGALMPGRAGSSMWQGLAKKLVKAPFMVAIAVGLFFFLTGLPMPGPVKTCVSSIANLNMPLGMFSIGIYMAQTEGLKMFTRWRLYRVAAVRLLVIPMVSLALLCLLPASMNDLKLAVLIAAACPVGSNVAVYAQLHGRDYGYAVETVAVSTLLSVATMPLMVGLAGILF